MLTGRDRTLPLLSPTGVNLIVIKSFFAALSFISRLPVPARLSQGLEIEQYQRSIVTFPLVGLLLGAIAGAVALLLQPWCGVPLAALFGVLALALLTGGFHLDGLADTCDGIFSAPHPRSDAGDHARQPAGHPRRAGADLRAGGESAGSRRAAAARIPTPSPVRWRRPAPSVAEWRCC